jgi:hypothetical protein
VEDPLNNPEQKEKGAPTVRLAQPSLCRQQDYGEIIDDW